MRFSAPYYPHMPCDIALLGAHANWMLIWCLRSDIMANSRLQALAVSDDCMDSVFALFELELEENNYDAAITLLSSHLNHSRADYVHRRLADACTDRDALFARVWPWHRFPALQTHPTYPAHMPSTPGTRMGMALSLVL